MKIKHITSVLIVVILCFSFTGCSTVKDLISFGKEIKETAIQENAYRKMNKEELLSLDNSELAYAVFIRTNFKTMLAESPEEAIKMLNEKEQVFYAVNEYLMEIENGGLCQFFANSSSFFASTISDYLDKIGATEHKLHYNSFIEINNININDLEKFKYISEEQYTSLCLEYDFVEFEYIFDVELTPLDVFLGEYIRKNIDYFI